MRSIQEWLGRPHLSWYYTVAADPEAMAPLMEYVYFDRAAEADFEVGGRSYGVFVHDWRRLGGVEWLERMAGRELGDDAAVPDAERENGPVLALLAAGVRRRGATCAARPASPERAGRKSPRCHARGARARDRAARAEALCALLHEAVDAMRADPREEKLGARPGPHLPATRADEEAAAELLDLPFSTYRGHLTRGLERVVDWLWQRELYGAGA